MELSEIHHEHIGIWIALDKMDEALVFTSSMSALVNGSPSLDFKVSRGLRQGGSLSLLFFILGAEGLARMIFKASPLGEFYGF